MNTPWGQSQTKETIVPGVHWVTTASHGGLMVAKATAERLLTVAAIETAFPGRFGDYVCFEEDCAYSVAFFEHPDWKRTPDERALREWEAMPSEPANSNPAYRTHMMQARVTAIESLTFEVAKQDARIREEMRAVAERWVPEYFARLNGTELARAADRQ